MFLDVLTRRNPQLLDVAVRLHRTAEIPPNCTVIDLDEVGHNVDSDPTGESLDAALDAPLCEACGSLVRMAVSDLNRAAWRCGECGSVRTA